MRHRLPQRTSVVPSLQLQHVSGCLISIVDEVPFTLRGLQTCGLSGQVPKPPAKKQTILHTNASLTPNSVTDRVAAKMIEHLTHHFHRHICSNNGPLGQAEKDVLNIEDVPYVLKQYIVLQAGLAFHDKDEEGRTSQGGRSS
ncbi:hypothetical protein PC128_g6054 [Phytophthora cactorum]|nr:hypothetical protein PC128_g6054 [Phytophthora cactorum]